MRIRHKHTLSRADRERKTRFFQALLGAGVTMSAWAIREGVTPSHVSQVLSGKRPGFDLDAKIAAFTAKHLRDLKQVPRAGQFHAPNATADLEP